jgi:fermentation-respiration switch protein FrsA (DUF1100 family)
VAALPCPVLFIHGRSDRLIPARMTQRLFDLAPAPKEIRWIEGYGHLNGTAAAEEELHRVVIGYLKSCFEADAQRRLD